MSKEDIKSKPVVAGLDIGTTKVVFLIGVIGPSGLEVVGVGQAPSRGVRHGAIVNIESTLESIRIARDEAELMAGITADEVWLGISGPHIQSFASTGMVAIKDEEVKQEDVNRVIEAAKAIAIPTDRQVLHVLPNTFKIDDQDGILDPIGMSGVRLETCVHIVTGSHAAIQNFIRCTEKAGLKLRGLVLQQLASGLSVLSKDEKDLGVSVVDIGGGTCDLITYLQGSVVHTAVVPVGGNNFTHDVSMGLRTTQEAAERLKKKYGCALASMVNEEETIEVESVGGRGSRTLSRRDLCDVIEARAEETMELVKQELLHHELLHRLGSGVVITGGTSQLPGLVEMGDFVFDIPVRKGAPHKVGGLTDIVTCPSFSTAVGLLLYGKEKDKLQYTVEKKGDDRMVEKVGGWARRLRDLFATEL